MISTLFKIPIPLPIHYLRKKAGVNPLIINYHVVSNEILPHIEHIYKYRNHDHFIEDLDILAKYYQPIDLHTYLDHLKNKQELPKSAMLLTIDDGLKEIYTNMAPVLLEKKIPATIFLTKNYIDNKELGYDHKKSLLISKLNELKPNDVQKLLIQFGLFEKNKLTMNQSIINISYNNRNIVDEIANSVALNFDNYLLENKPYITSSQIKELVDNGFTIGGHSIDHAKFTELSLSDQINQAVESVDYVCNKFSVGYRVFAFPYWDGGISHEFFKLMENKVDATFGTQGMLTDPATLNHQRIGIERFSHPTKRMIKAHYFRKIIYKLLRKHIISRN